MSYPARGTMPCMAIDGKAGAAGPRPSAISTIHRMQRTGAA
jgi:hypothetical protein